MAYQIEQSYEAILNRWLTDWANQLPDVDRSVGTMCFMLSSMCAACEWGLRKNVSWLARQIIPTTSDSAQIDRHLAARGLSRDAGETDAECVEKLLGYLLQPPAGGNQYDWVRWAEDVSWAHNSGLASEWTEQVSDAVLDENGRGVGTINVAIVSDREEDPDDYDPWVNATVYTAGDIVRDDSYEAGTFRAYQAITSGTSNGTGVADDTGVEWEDCEGYATADLVAYATTTLDGLRPVGIWDYQVLAARKIVVDVSMTVSGDMTAATVAAAVTAYMRGLAVGATLHTAQLISVAIDTGATNVVLSSPAADVAPSFGPVTYERIWPGTITVSVA